MSWLYYLLEANLYLLIFFAVYHLLLRRETYYQLNRAYLLVSSAVAFVLPFLQLGMLKPVQEVSTVVTQIRPIMAVPVVQQVQVQAPQPVQQSINYYLLAYGIIAALLFINLCFKLFRLYQLARAGKRVEGSSFRMISIDEEVPAFSFFRLLFINKQLTESDTIIRHELVHIRQRHSWDIIYLEVLKIINWFNPAVYLLQNSLKELHEYIADAQINYSQEDINHYIDFLLSNAYGTYNTSLTNNFFHKNLLKKRIIMLHQKRSGYLARLKYLAFIPAIGGMLCASTMAFSKSYGYVDLLPGKQTGDTKLPPPPPPEPPKSANRQTAKHPVPPPPPPTILKPAYHVLPETSGKVAYPESAYKEHKQGLVLLGFNLDNSGKINDVKVLQGAGYGMDETAVNILKGLKKPITDKAGSHKISIIFCLLETQKLPTITKKMWDDPEFVGEFAISDALHYPAYRDMILPGNKHKNTLPPPPPAPPVEKDQTQGALTIDTTYGFGSFYKYVAKSTRYPAKERANIIGGRVFVAFAVDENKHLTGIKTLRAPSKALSEEVVRVIKNCTNFNNFKPGQTYTLPVAFSLQQADGNWADTHNDNTGDTKDYAGFGTVDTHQKLLSLDEIVVVGYLNTTDKPQGSVQPKPFDKFYGELNQNIAYPKRDAKQQKDALVSVSFMVDNQHVEQLKVTGPDQQFIKSVEQAVKACKNFSDFKTGYTYTLLVEFRMYNKDGSSINKYTGMPSAPVIIGHVSGVFSKDTPISLGKIKVAGVVNS